MKKSIRQRTVTREVIDAVAAASGSAPCDATSTEPPKPVSFATDISPIFQQFRGPMAWRLDLTDYNAVLGNAELIYHQIKTRQMPPPPFPPLTDEQIETFANWMSQECPP